MQHNHHAAPRAYLRAIGTATVLVLASGGIARAGDVQLDTAVQRFSYAIGTQIGHRLKSQKLDDLDAAAIGAAIGDVLAGRAPRLKPEEMRAAAAEYQKTMAARITKEAAANKAAEKAFLAQNKDKDGVVTLPSGLQYKVLKAGTGKQPAADGEVTVNYRGRLLDGTVFDSSYKRGKPVDLHIAQVIKGWQEALPLMKEGAKWEVYIPSALAYGERGAGGVIGPDQMLIFQIELLKVH